MVTIQSGMLIALGFLAASLFGLLVAPAFWRRAVRLTTRRLKDTMPLSEMEIEADRDRIRAEYAIKMHKLESLVEHVKLAGARQQIEINRRDARVNMLEADLEKLRANYEEAQNARRVLEQTIGDRLPRIETRLSEARQVLNSRDREVAKLTETTESQMRALAEASAINAEQQSEIERLSTSLSKRDRGKHNAQANAEADQALKAELEGLRTKAREQAALLARLQSYAGRAATPAGGAPAGAGAAAQVVDLEKQVRALRARNDDQAGEIARLKAAIAVFEQEPAADSKSANRDTRVAMKARVHSLEAQSSQQGETILKLRSELAAANERLARQAQHFTNELKRLGPETRTAGRRRSSTGGTGGARPSLADRVAQARDHEAVTGAVVQLQQPVAKGAAEAAPGEAERLAASEIPAAAEDGKVDGTGIDGSGATSAVVAGEAATVADAGKASAESDDDAGKAEATGGRRARLIDRIAGMSRSS